MIVDFFQSLADVETSRVTSKSLGKLEDLMGLQRFLVLTSTGACIDLQSGTPLSSPPLPPRFSMLLKSNPVNMDTEGAIKSVVLTGCPHYTG